MLAMRKKWRWQYLLMVIAFIFGSIMAGGCGGGSSNRSGSNGNGDSGDGGAGDGGDNDAPALEFEYGDVYSISIEFNGPNVLNFEYQPLNEETETEVKSAAETWEMVTAATGDGHFVYIGGSGYLANTETFSHELIIDGVEVSLQVSNSDGSTQARIDINVEQKTYEVTFIENGQPKPDAGFDPEEGLKVNDEPVTLHEPDEDGGNGDGDNDNDNPNPNPENPDLSDPNPDNPNPDQTGGDDNGNGDGNGDNGGGSGGGDSGGGSGGGGNNPTPTVTYTVTFDANGGTGSMSAQSITANTATALVANAFTRENYKFDGWNTDSDGGGTAYADKASVTLSANLTLYAQWKQLFALQSKIADPETGTLTFYSDADLTKTIEQAATGDTVYVKATPTDDNVQQSLLRMASSGLVLEKVQVTYLDASNAKTYAMVSENVTDGYFSFTMPDIATTVAAAFGPQYEYVDHSVDTEGNVTTVSAKAPAGYVLASDQTYQTATTLPAGFYVLAGNNESLASLTAGGDVKLLLRDNSTTRAGSGITVPSGTSLTIYTEGGGTGKLTADAGSTGNAGIGGLSGGINGEITIHGGVITATGGKASDGAGAGIGGGHNASGGAVTIYGGTITANGVSGYNSSSGSIYASAGIGGGSGGSGGAVEIYGGMVAANGGEGHDDDEFGQGIGCGLGGAGAGILTVDADLAVSHSGDGKAYTDYTGTEYESKRYRCMKVVTPVALTSGTTTWTAGNVYKAPDDDLTINDTVNVTGDVTLVIANGDSLEITEGLSIAAGVTLTVKGGGAMNVYGSNGDSSSTTDGSGTLMLTSGTLNARGGNGTDADEESETDGIDGGAAVNGLIIVTGGKLLLTGGDDGGSTFTANGGAGGAAVNGDVTIYDGTMTATKGDFSGDYISGKLTLGVGITLYEGLAANVHNILDANSGEREYIGERKKQMYAAKSETILN